MESFELCVPTKVVFGAGAVERAGEEAKAIGSTALIVTGRGSAERSGLLEKVEGLLADAGLKVLNLKGVQPNPRLATVRKGVEIARAGGVDLLVGLGGGSAMDTAKAVAAGVVFKGDLWDMTSHGQRPYVPPTETLPTMMIPTLAATGSEINGNAVLTNEETEEKAPILAPACCPRVSVIDPTLTFTVPATHTAYGAADIIAHAIEPYLNGVDDTPIQDRIQEGVMLTVMENAPKAIAKPDDLSARANLQWASIWALNAWVNAGCAAEFPMHKIGHVLGAHYDVAHGAGLAAVIPAWMKVACRHRLDRYAQFNARVFGAETAGRDAEEIAAEGIKRLETFFKQIGCPTRLGEMGIGSDGFDRICQDTLRTGGENGLLAGRPRLDFDGIKQVLEMAL